jgi:DNA-binding NarL/FixJ family response regulator
MKSSFFGVVAMSSSVSNAVCTTRIRVLVVEDHEVVRRQICRMLGQHADLEIVCAVGDGEDAVRRAGELQPDVILLDISLPHLDGFTTARHIRSVAPAAQILFVSQHDTTQMVREALRAGGKGYVSKLDAVQDLVPAIHAVNMKQRFISPRLARYL